MGLLETIKKAGLDAVDAENPVKVVFGEVTKTNPLEVNVEQRFTLSADFLVLTESVRDGLQTGDRVVMLRVQGGPAIHYSG